MDQALPAGQHRFALWALAINGSAARAMRLSRGRHFRASSLVRFRGMQVTKKRAITENSTFVKNSIYPAMQFVQNS